MKVFDLEFRSRAFLFWRHPYFRQNVGAFVPHFFATDSIQNRKTRVSQRGKNYDPKRNIPDNQG
jgi:hypothetical protein